MQTPGLFSNSITRLINRQGHWSSTEENFVWSWNTSSFTADTTIKSSTSSAVAPFQRHQPGDKGIKEKVQDLSPCCIRVTEIHTHFRKKNMWTCFPLTYLLIKSIWSTLDAFFSIFHNNYLTFLFHHSFSQHYCFSRHIADITANAFMSYCEGLFAFHIWNSLHIKVLQKRKHQWETKYMPKRRESHTLLNLLLSEQTFIHKERKHTYLISTVCKGNDKWWLFITLSVFNELKCCILVLEEKYLEKQAI